MCPQEEHFKERAHFLCVPAATQGLADIHSMCCPMLGSEGDKEVGMNSSSGDRSLKPRLPSVPPKGGQRGQEAFVRQLLKMGPGHFTGNSQHHKKQDRPREPRAQQLFLLPRHQSPGVRPPQAKEGRQLG